MPLGSGARLGPYEVLSALGAGGMGEVYRARDPRLGRDVAIKVLAEGFASNPDRLRRFEHEARATGALNHPNVLAVLDVGSHEGAPYLVSELLEGDTLRERLRRGALTPRKALEYGMQIAQGLAAAHGKGILHRDLKPANLFLTRDGRVKILDFGLAKLRRDREDDENTTASTASGAVLGTASYMSPEQVRGEQADHRSDIFSLGIVLYEMLSHEKPFSGETSAEMMTAILRHDPPKLPSVDGLSAGVDRIVRRCLEKDPDLRFQNAQDVAFALEATTGAETVVAAPRLPRRRSLRWIATLATGLCLAFGAYLLGTARPTASPKLPAFQRLTFRRGVVTSARITTDGATVVYSASWEGGGSIRMYARPVAGRDATPLNLEQADVLGLSPGGEILFGRRSDGTQLATSFEGTLARVPLAGSAAKDLLENVSAADWSPDGRELAVARIVEHETRLEYPVGKVLYETSDHIGALRVSPHGDRLAFAADNADEGTRIDIVDLRGTRTTLSRGWQFRTAQVAWAASGHEVWFTALDLGWKASLRAATLSGQERQILVLPAWLQLQDIARDGRVLLAIANMRAEMFGRAPGEEGERNLSWYESSSPLSLSPDGRILLFSEAAAIEQGSGGSPLYLRGTDGSPAVKISTGFPAALSSDGRWVASCPDMPLDRVHIVPTGAGEARSLTLSGALCRDLGWFPDNRRLLVTAQQAGQSERSYIVDADSGALRALTSEGIVCGPLSPDGRDAACRDAKGHLTFQAIAGGAPRPVPGLEPGELVGTWSADGRRLVAANWAAVPVRVFLVDAASGRRTFWREFKPSDMTGLASEVSVVLTADLKAYVYRYRRLLSDLYLVDGLR